MPVEAAAKAIGKREHAVTEVQGRSAGMSGRVQAPIERGLRLSAAGAMQEIPAGCGAAIMPFRDDGEPGMRHERQALLQDRIPARDRAGRPKAVPRYDRHRDLPRLVPLLPEDLAISTPEQHARLLALLRRALRLERGRGKAGHWAYDLGRHAALLRAYRTEQAEWLARRAGAASGCRRGRSRPA